MSRLPAEKQTVSTALERLKRVGDMSMREALYRLGEKVRTELDRLRASAGDAGKKSGAKPGRSAHSSFHDYLRGEPSGRFYFNPAARLGIFHRIADGYPGWIEAAAFEADRLCEHKVRILGFGEIELGREIDWHRDPVTGKSWPRKFWTDYDPVRDCSCGDSKVIHELNRHSHLPMLAKAYFLTGEEKYAVEAISQLRGWILQNPPLFGINWQSSLEIALRCTSWLWSLFFLLPSRSLDRETADRIGYSLFAQLEHVSRYPSIYSSPNTHLFGEAAVLCIAGMLFREDRRARRWYRRGMALLAEQLKKQILPDGVHIELSTYYHCYTIDFCLQVMALARRNGIEVSQEARESLERMVEFLAHVTLPDGTVPRLGDDDGGRALVLTRDDYSLYPEAFCSASVLLDRADFKYLAGSFREDTFWLLGDEALEAFNRLETRVPSRTRASFPAGGYFVQRSDWSTRADHVIMDCGGLGLPRGGHGHADTLSFALASRGREILVDPGTYRYNGAVRWRNHFRTTAAHNTVTVDGVPQSEPGGTFQWRSQARARIRRRLNRGGISYVEAEHDGYTRLPDPVKHLRRLLYCGGYWTLVDEFSGAGEHTFEASYQYAPGIPVEALEDAGDGRQIRVSVPGDAALELVALSSGRVTASVAEGSEDPIQGWVSRRYGAREPAPLLNLQMRAPVPSLLVTLLFPSAFLRGHRRFPQIYRLQAGHGVIACEIAGGFGRDILVCSPSQPETAVADLAVAAEFAHIRLDAEGACRSVFGAGVRRLEHRGKSLFANHEPAPFLIAGSEGDSAPKGVLRR
jgi:hypothetical protein